MHTGGVSNQFLRVATKMKSIGYRVAIIDYADGAMGRECDLLDLSLIEYKDDSFAKVPDGSVLIMQSMTPWTIWRGLDITENTKILFWTCHADNFIPYVPLLSKYINKPRIGKYLFRIIFPFLYLRMQSYINRLDKASSLIYIDAPCKSSIKNFYNLDLKENNFVPVPVPDIKSKRSIELTKNNESKNSLNNERQISAGWVGRIAYLKYPILLHTIKRISEESDSMKIKVDFHVIGSGPLLTKLKSEVNKISNMNIIFHGELNQQKLAKIIKEKIHLVFSMGTSALEAASHCKPTSLLNFTHEKIVKYHKYSWLFEQDGFSVGRKITNKLSNEPDNMKLILKEFIEDKAELGIRSREYVLKNHSLKAVVEKLEKHIDLASCNFTELKSLKVFRPPLVYKIYKMVNF